MFSNILTLIVSLVIVVLIGVGIYIADDGFKDDLDEKVNRKVDQSTWAILWIAAIPFVPGGLLWIVMAIFFPVALPIHIGIALTAVGLPITIAGIDKDGLFKINPRLVVGMCAMIVGLTLLIRILFV